MKKKLASLGTALSRDEAKKILGGDVDQVQVPSDEFGTCTVRTNCSNGFVECSGSMCSKGTNSVRCDGTTTNC